MIAGPAGSGKSTLALACALQGLRYLGDDYVVVDVANGPIVHSLYSSAKALPSTHSNCSSR